MAHTARFTIRLGLPEGINPEDPKVQEALESLLEVMLVQADDGLYLLGHEDAELDDVENDYFGEFTPYTGSLRSQDVSIIIDPSL